MNPVLTVALTSFIVNIPMGYKREGYRKFSFGWIIWIHLSVPFIIALRIWFHIHPIWIPLFIALAVAGQIIGARLRR